VARPDQDDDREEPMKEDTIGSQVRAQVLRDAAERVRLGLVNIPGADGDTEVPSASVDDDDVVLDVAPKIESAINGVVAELRTEHDLTTEEGREAFFAALGEKLKDGIVEEIDDDVKDAARKAADRAVERANEEVVEVPDVVEALGILANDYEGAAICRAVNSRTPAEQAAALALLDDAPAVAVAPETAPAPLPTPAEVKPPAAPFVLSQDERRPRRAASRR
jgi:hypothetical protein